LSTSQPIQQATIQQYARQLYLTTMAGQFANLAEEAVRKKQSHLSYLEVLLEAEIEERDRRAVTRRIKEAHFPAVKTLEEFDFPAAPHIPVALIKKLSEGEYLERKEPIVLIGETGTGKSHLAVALAVAACRQRKRVRFTTAAELVTEMIEAQSQLQLTRVRNRWMRYELVVLDELGYVVMPDAAAELLFQVIAGRAEQAAIIVTTNLPFSEWPAKIPNARLCKAGSLTRPGPHHRDRHGELPFSQNHGQERRQGMMNKQWYYAQLRWAVMVEGKEGLREWKEAVHIFLSEDEKTAFQQALEIGRLGEDIHTEGRREVQTRLAEVVRLDYLGSGQTQFEVRLGSSKARERLPFDHVFNPEEHMPESPF
jgi:DNA replication protein DnaC